MSSGEQSGDVLINLYVFNLSPQTGVLHAQIALSLTSKLCKTALFVRRSRYLQDNVDLEM